MKPSTVLASLVLAAIASQPASALTQSLAYLGQETFPTSTTFGGTTVGGLSGIVYDTAASRYYAISDDRSQINSARFYTLSINIADGVLAPGDVQFTGVTTLLQPNGQPFPAAGLDPEGIALVGSSVYISSEGANTASQIQSPFVNRFNLATGQQESGLTIAAKFQPANTSGNATNGVRNNLAFETLTQTPGGKIVTATENALAQDGPAAALGVSSPSRVAIFDPVSGASTGEYLYTVEPVALAPNPSNQFATNGLVDMLALSETSFLAIERSFSVGAVGTPGNTGNTIKLFEVSFANATDISAIDGLTANSLAGIVGAEKELLFDLTTLGIPMDNIEGITFGPVMNDGRQSLILVSDNNFSGTQFTQFVAFAVTPIPEPGTYAMLAGALALGCAGFRRARLA